MPRHETDRDYKLLSNPDLAQTGSAIWDSRFREYVIRSSLAHADITFGAFALAIQAHELEESRLRDKYGPRPWGAEEELHRVSFARISAAEATRDRDYLDPLWRAAAELVMTPAPNMIAALFKVALIEVEELDSDPYTTRDPMEILLEDVGRLTGDPGLAPAVLPGCRMNVRLTLQEVVGEA